MLWGPRHHSGQVLVVIGATLDDLEPFCDSVEVGAELNHPFARPGENRPIFVCRWNGNLRESWPLFKAWG